MPKVMVHKVERFDIVKGGRCILPRMETREGAKILGGKVIEGSGVVIDASRLEHGEQFTGDADAEVHHVGDVRQPLLTRRMVLTEDPFAFGPMLGSPGA